MAGAVPERTLLDRHDLIEELISRTNAAAAGSGSVVVLTGEAGIGKTSVARAVARATRDTMTVSWGNCSADRSAPPFWPWRDLAPVDTSDSETNDSTIGAARFERLSDLRHAVITAGEPRLHIIEDLQWADVASVLLLGQVAAAAAAAPLMLIATLRTGEDLGPELSDAIAQARRDADGYAIRPLGLGAVATMLRDAGAEDDPALARLLHDRTGGNPLYVTELLRAAPASEPSELRRVLSHEVPARVAELITQRMTQLPDAVAETVRAAAVVGFAGDARTLAAVTSRTPAAVVDLLEQARAARLVDAAPAGRWQFTHELVRDAVYTAMPGAQRATTHASALEALAASGTAPAPVLAHHALAAQPLFDPERAVALAARAGESAFAHHAYEEAVGWFDRALATAASDVATRWRAELLVLHGEALRNMGELTRARESFLAAAELTRDAALLARAALGYADPGADLGIAYRSHDPVTAELLVAALAAQPEDELVTVRLEARIAAELYFSDQPSQARASAAAATARASRLGDRRALVIANAVRHDAFVVGQTPLEEQLRGSAQLVEWAQADGATGALLTAHRARVFDLLAAGDLAAMDVEVTAFTRVAEPLNVPAYLWWPALWSAMRALLEGRHREAEDRAVAAFSLGEPTFPVLAFMNLSFLLFFLRREEGRFAEMEQATRDTVASQGDIPALRVALAFLLAEIGKTDEARGLLAALAEDDFARLRDRNWPASWFQLARTAFLTGDATAAATLLAERHHPTEPCVMVSLGTVCLGATALGTAWLHHTLGDHDGARAHYDAAEALNARLGARSWVDQTRADRAALTEPATHAAAAGTFRRDATVWTLAFAGTTAQVPHARGMVDLAVLLARPEQAVSVLELLGDVDDTRGAEALDERARREIRARLRELDEEVADAEATHDGERAAAAREQLQLLAETVARDFGLGGKTRRVGDPIERARKTVSVRIRRTIATIKQAHPTLGRHLERSIDTGTFCAYRPAEGTSWEI